MNPTKRQVSKHGLNSLWEKFAHSGCRKTYFVKSVFENCEHVMDALPENVNDDLK